MEQPAGLVAIYLYSKPHGMHNCVHSTAPARGDRDGSSWAGPELPLGSILQGSRSRVRHQPGIYTARGQNLTPKAPLGPANRTHRTNKRTPPKKRGGREVGPACLHTGGAPCRAGESQNLPSATPLPSWRALGSCFPVRKIRFGSAGCLKNLHASDLKGKGAQEKLSTNVKITQPGVCLPGPCWSRDVCELRAGRSGSEVSRGTPRNPVRVCPQRLESRGMNNC